MLHSRRSVLGLLAGATFGLAGCAAGPRGPVDPAERARDVAALRDAILALGPGIDPAEAARAAQVSYSETDALARQYGITDPPLIHNSKVNMGLRTRGLCWHWAEDLERRLKAEGFRTLAIHRAIANADNPFRIDHSTAVISRAGDGVMAGIVIDPWRKGGVLTWARLREDKDYRWRPRREVLAEKRARALARQGG